MPSMQERALNILVGQQKQCIYLTHSPPKKGKEKYINLVLKCTSRLVLTADLIRKFSRQARSYMLTYKWLLEIVGEHSNNQSDKKSTDITHKQIENMQKKFRSCHAPCCIWFWQWLQCHFSEIRKGFWFETGGWDRSTQEEEVKGKQKQDK